MLVAFARIDFHLEVQMSDAAKQLKDFSPADEAREAELGDTRLTERYGEVTIALKHRPDASVPEALEDEAAQEGYYRFIRNPSVDYGSLTEPHYQASAERAEQLDTVLCLHDTTEFAFPVHDGQMREDLSRLSANRQGFQWHSSLVCAADGTRAPLGLIDSQPFVHLDDLPDAASRAFWEEKGGIFAENEKWRWMENVERADRRLEEVDKVIHVMDREAADYQLLFAMEVCGYDSIVRMTRSDRRLSVGELRSDHAPLSEELGARPWASSRTVELSPRSKAQADDAHPVRRQREATLKARSATVTLRRPDNVEADSAPDELEVNVVEVLEVNPPAGEEPVHWLLVTTEPVGTTEEIWRVVDRYRTRWVTEEFYQSIKTGTDYTSLQHRSAKTLLAALAPSAVVAHHLLVLRFLSRHAEDFPALTVVTATQLEVLRAEKPDLIPEEDPTVGDVMRAVARLGGHISSNGPAGWEVLGRGWERLVEYDYGFRLARRLEDL